MTLAPPVGILCELTHRCPLQCPYCSNPVELGRASVELDTEVWCRVLSEAADLGVVHVHLSGGEPTARKDLGTIVAHAARAGLYTNLITSGVLLDRNRLERLAECGLDHVQLSVQGIEANEADRIAGYRGHAKKLAVARMTREIGLPLTLNAVVHRQNLDQLDRLIDLAVELGAGRLEVAHVQYHGWAYRNRAALVPTRAQLEAATASVMAARERLRGILVIDYVVPDYYARRPKACMGGWGRMFLNVTPSGLVLPCHAAQTIPGMRFDSVTEMPLAQIWQNSEAFRAFRGTEWMSEPCRSCAYREEDWGGCRCQAAALAGTAAATDPACELSPLHGALVVEAEEASASGTTDFTYRTYANAASRAEANPADA